MLPQQRFFAFATIFLILLIASSASAFSQEISIMVNEDATANIQQKIYFEPTEEIASIGLLCENIWNLAVQNASHESSGTEITLTKNAGVSAAEINYSADCMLTKTQEKWVIIINLTPEQNIEAVKISLPSSSSITGFVPAASIKFEAPHLVINWEKYNLTESYVSVEYLREHGGNEYLFFAVAAVIFIVLAAAFFAARKLLPKTKKMKAKKEVLESDALKGLSEGERSTIKIIASDEGLSQKLLQERAKLPKATLSRILHKLKERGFIEIVQSGYTNKIYLSEWLKGKEKEKNTK